MAFEEVGKWQEAGDDYQHGTARADSVARAVRGLPMRWEALEEECCPRCGDVLSFFENVDLFKCPCGFKISKHRLRQVVRDMHDDPVQGYARGYSHGNYDDDPPF